MGEETKKRKCIFCDKKLLDEKLPLCLRCRLEGRNATAKCVEVAGAVAVAVSGVKTIKDNSGGHSV